jgi:hypothetical protein
VVRPSQAVVERKFNPPGTDTYRKLRRAIDGQRLLGRVGRRTSRNHDAPACPLTSHVADRQLDEIQHAAVVDVEDLGRRLEQLAGIAAPVFEVVVLFRHACVGDGDVDMPRLLVGRLKVRPRRRITPDEDGAGGDTLVGGREVEEEGSGAFGDQDLGGGKTDAGSSPWGDGQMGRCFAESITLCTCHEGYFPRHRWDALLCDVERCHAGLFAEDSSDPVAVAATISQT